MEVAREIQSILIPKTTPKIPGYSVGMMYRGAEEVSGDYIDFIEVKKGFWGMVVADVSGKGVPGGLVMAQTRSTLRTVAQEHVSPSQVLSMTQRKLYLDIRPDMFVTASYLVLDAAHATTTMARAGHPAALVFVQKNQRVELALPSGVAIGITEPETFESLLIEKKIAMAPGDFIFLYTDGVDESCNAIQELFGHKRIIESLESSAKLPAQEIVARLEEAIKTFIQKAPQHDDMTMIVLKRDN
jgi:sigma-B regulation protein RsbU (phosphoserine phosphatase)